MDMLSVAAAGCAPVVGHLPGPVRGCFARGLGVTRTGGQFGLGLGSRGRGCGTPGAGRFNFGSWEAAAVVAAAAAASVPRASRGTSSWAGVGGSNQVRVGLGPAASSSAPGCLKPTLSRSLAARAAGPLPGLSLMDLATAPADPSGGQVLPFGDGGHDQEAQAPRLYTHGACKSKAAQAAVLDCQSWRTLAPGSPERHELAMEALKLLRSYGFVVLENLLDGELVGELEAQAVAHLDSFPGRGGGPAANGAGVTSQPLRAGRTEVPPPCEGVWASEWLLRNELCLEVASHYICNQIADGRSEDEQQWSWVQWVTAGSDLDWIRSQGPAPAYSRQPLKPGCSQVGADGERGPWLGQVTFIETPAFTQPQKRHRDIILPGPCAQLTMQIALTPLTATNGPVAFRQSSHIMHTPGFEVVAVPPQGSVVLYDSFTEHRGIENQSGKTRLALYAEFEARGVFTGYQREHFGVEGAEHLDAFRRLVNPELRRWVT